MLVALLIVVCAASAASAQIEKGDIELQGSGNLNIVSGSTAMQVQGLVGYCITKELQFGGGPTISVISIDSPSGSNTNTTFGLTFFGRFNFSTKTKLVPYLNGQLLQYDIAPEEPVAFLDCTYLQGGAGFKYFLREHVAWDTSANLGLSVGETEFSFSIVTGISAIL